MAKQHKADGLYYINGKMIEKAHACGQKRRQFCRVSGTTSKKVPVPVTLAVAKAMNVDGDASGWMMRRLHETGKINQKEFDYYWAGISKYCRKVKRPNWPYAKAKLAMDVLARRAKRERLV